MLTQHYKPNIPACFFCTSSDVKPTDCENGSTLHEIDTGKIYRFDAENLVWHEKQSSAAPVDSYTRAQTDSMLASKVDKADGKQLSTEDYTSADKSKLAGIESGANHTDIDATLSHISTNPVQNKVVSDALDLKAEGSDLSDHTSDTNNPHSVTKAQLGLGSVDNTSDANKPISIATQAALNAKQDTISDLETIRSGAASGSAALQQSDITSSYSSSGTSPINGAAVAAAIGTLDVAEQGGDGKYIKSISETDGKIAVVVETMDTAPTDGSVKAVTSGGVQAALAGKQAALTFDSTPTANSTNPVTSGGVKTDQDRQDALEAEDRAALAELIDSGAKNLCLTFTDAAYTNLTFVVGTNGAVSVSGTAPATIAKRSTTTLSSGTYILSGGVSEQCRLDVRNAGTNIVLIADTGSTAELELQSETAVDICILVAKGATVSETIYPMLCTKAAWDISQEYVPYRPSYDELIARIEALESGETRSVSTLATLSKSATVVDDEELLDYAEEDAVDEVNENATNNDELR